MPGIFISYRRGDTAGYVGRLCDSLNEHFGPTPIFRDIDSIDPGLDFVDQIGQAVGSCDVCLAVIGTGWLTATKKDGQRRLHDPQDYVRLEIQEALSRNIRVIPVLVGGASMPSVEDLPAELSALARRNAFELSDRWEYDVGRLLSSLTKVPGLEASRPTRIDTREAGRTVPESARTSPNLHGRVQGAILGLLISVPLLVFLVVLNGLVLDALEKTVVKIGFLSLPPLGVIVGGAIGDLDTRLRSAVAGATIGGANALFSWPLGWWLWSDSNLPGGEPMELFKAIMLYLPGTVIASALVGVATVSVAQGLSTRLAKPRNM
jgi:TIR domain